MFGLSIVLVIHCILIGGILNFQWRLSPDVELRPKSHAITCYHMYVHTATKGWAQIPAVVLYS